MAEKDGIAPQTFIIEGDPINHNHEDQITPRIEKTRVFEQVKLAGTSQDGMKQSIDNKMKQFDEFGDD